MIKKQIMIKMFYNNDYDVVEVYEVRLDVFSFLFTGYMQGIFNIDMTLAFIVIDKNLPDPPEKELFTTLLYLKLIQCTL